MDFRHKRYFCAINQTVKHYDFQTQIIRCHVGQEKDKKWKNCLAYTVYLTNLLLTLYNSYQHSVDNFFRKIKIIFSYSFAFPGIIFILAQNKIRQNGIR